MSKFLIDNGASLHSTTRSGEKPTDVAKSDEVKAALQDLDVPAVSSATVKDDSEKFDESDKKRSASGAASGAPSPKKPKKERAYLLNINDAVDKEYEGSSFTELCDAPVSAIQGIGPVASAMLKKLKVKTVRDLGTWKFYKMAKSIVALAPKEKENGRVDGSILNINAAMDKAHEVKSLTQIMTLKPSALQGLAPWVDEEFKSIHVTT